MLKRRSARLTLIAALAWSVLGGAIAAQADQYQLYAAMGNHELVWVDPDTPALNIVGEIGEFSPRAMTYDLANEIIYAVDLQDTTKLAVIDPMTGVGTYLGTMTLPEPDFVGRVEALAYNASDGLLYCSVSVSDYNANSEALGIVDPLTQEVTILGQFEGTYADDGDAMVFIDGELYLVDDPHLGPSYFYRVDYQDIPGQATLIGVLDDPRFNNVNDLAFDPETRILYGFDPHARQLITIDWSIGQGTLLGQTHEPGDFGGSIISSLTVGPPFSPNGVADDTPGAWLERLQIAPNPFNPATTISFRVPGNAGETVPIQLAVFDLAGHLVRELHAGPMPAGPGSLRWDGKDARGIRVGSGAYIVRLRAKGRLTSQAMTVLK